MEPEQELKEDERVEISARPSPWSYLTAYLLGLFLLFMTLKPLTVIAGFLLLVVVDLHRRGNRYFVTNDRIIREFKFLKRDSQEATTDLISDVSINQSLNQRMVHIGDVHVKTASGEDIKLSGVKHPGSVKSEVSTVKNREKNSPQEVKVVEDENGRYCPNCGEKLDDREDISAEKILDQPMGDAKEDIKALDTDIEELIEAEEEEKNRKTMIDWLEEHQ